ncbi:sensor histidine kinase [Methylophaga thiooxydans]|uniref:sensor histidine kinase n=1 Tax=Methylophaga thiooxydans TaxID=392484 RepID=UPI0023577E3B|nr:ATP-binding protein [Methylophaga thiooxydans]
MRRLISYFHGSFRNKILALIALIFIPFLLVLFLTSQKIMTASLSKQFYTHTENLSEVIRTSLKPLLLTDNLAAIDEVTRSLLQLQDVAFIRVFSYDQAILEVHRDTYPQRKFQLDKQLLAATDGYYDVEYIFQVENTAVGKVQVSFSINQQRALLMDANQKLVMTAVVMTSIGLLLTWLLAEQVSNKIRLLEHASNRIARGDARVTLPLDGHDEIARTGRAFKNMMHQIKEKYEALNLSPDGILIVSAQHLITYTNPALHAMFGTHVKHLIGQTLNEFEQLLLRTIDKKSHETVESLEDLLQLTEFRVHLPDFKVLKCIKKRVNTNAGDAFSEVFYLRDITHESEVDRMKSEFLTTAAHELRTPLASVMGYSELLMVNEYPEEKTKFVADTINRQAQNLKHLVDDLLDIAKIEARSNAVLELNHGNVQQLVKDCCDYIAATSSHCELIFEPDNCAWPIIEFDEHKLEQAVMNILSNAYKYSKQNGIVIVDTVVINQEIDGLSWFGIRITDQGIGMNQTQLSRVGEKFYRADNAGSVPGTGLGMALTCEILALHSGHLDITSQPNQGTQVTLWIPTFEADIKVRGYG